DDPLLLPVRPGVCPRGAQRDRKRLDDRCELCPPFRHPCWHLRKARAAPGLDLDLGRDQLADEMWVDGRSARRGLDVLEPVHEVERGRVEEGEFLLYRHREILPGLELLAREPELLVRAQTLLVAHGSGQIRAMRRAAAVRLPPSSIASQWRASRPRGER